MIFHTVSLPYFNSVLRTVIGYIVIKVLNTFQDELVSVYEFIITGHQDHEKYDKTCYYPIKLKGAELGITSSNEPQLLISRTMEHGEPSVYI